MILEVWHIHGSGFHFGRHGIGQEETGVTFASDSLLAALLARLAVLKGAAAVETWAQALRQNPPIFVLSSAFPRAGAVRFFPRPLLQGPTSKPAGASTLKSLKRVRFVSEAIFRRLLDGEDLTGLADEGVWLQNGAALISQVELAASGLAAGSSTLWSIEQRPRVTVGRQLPTITLYFTGRVSFASGCGLWFGVRWLNVGDGDRALLADLIADLGDCGLGGDRSSGFGQAAIEPAGTCELPDAAGRPWVTLSRYLPLPEEMSALADERAAYTLETVGGWVDSPARKSERRKAVHLLAEGSQFGPLDKLAPGQLADVQPNYAGLQPLGHPVWRCGVALAVGTTSPEPKER